MPHGACCRLCVCVVKALGGGAEAALTLCDPAQWWLCSPDNSSEAPVLIERRELQTRVCAGREMCVRMPCGVPQHRSELAEGAQHGAEHSTNTAGDRQMQ